VKSAIADDTQFEKDAAAKAQEKEIRETSEESFSNPTVMKKLATKFGMLSFVVEAYAKAFQVFDEDHSGTIDDTELTKVLSGLGQTIEPHKLKHVLKKCDDIADAERAAGTRIIMVDSANEVLDFEDFLQVWPFGGSFMIVCVAFFTGRRRRCRSSRSCGSSTTRRRRSCSSSWCSQIWSAAPNTSARMCSSS
jgi:hypothetical protein